MQVLPKIAIAATGVLGVFAATPSIAQSTMAMFDTLSKGSWELTYRDGRASQRICVRSGREFIRLRHPAGDCNRFVVEDSRDGVTVQYTCRGDGYGRTTIRRESAELVQIESQGIKGGRPFQFSAEARRAGPCG